MDRARVERPEPSAEHAASPPFEPGPLFLHQLFKRFLDRITEAERCDLGVWLAGLGCLSVATACSGADSPLLVWQALRDAVNSYMGLHIEVQHQFSCEKAAKKQAFLQKLFDMPALCPGCQ